MTAGGPGPRLCREGCGVKVLVAKRQPSGKWWAFEARDRTPRSDESIGCYVLVNSQAWSPADLAEQIQVTHELDEVKARELVDGYPWHRPHQCRERDDAA